MAEPTEREPLTEKQVRDILWRATNASSYADYHQVVHDVRTLAADYCRMTARAEQAEAAVATLQAELDRMHERDGEQRRARKAAEARVRELTQLVADVGRDHDAAVARAENAEAALKQANELVELLRRARAELHLDRDQVRAELVELRDRLGEPDVEWSVLHVSGRDEPLDEADARRFAAQAASAGARLQSRIVGEWRDVDATPRTDLERAADEQGVRAVGDVSELVAAEDGRPTDEEFAAFDAARRDGDGDA